ncbi:MAG: hypothetical protein L6R35_006266 [Caloplaca aegaea]|nr:MAG: hypothetical protein L6R35_006266 [Caloplaca aegaea]
MPPFNLCKKPTASSSFIRRGIYTKQQHPFQPSCQSLNTKGSTAEEHLASALPLPEASGSDEDLPDLDHVLESQHAAATTSTGAQGSLLGQILPPTPATTPMKPQQHTPSYANSLRTPLVTRIVPTATPATPPRTSKRPHITHSDSDDDDEELPITPSKRARNRRTTANAPRFSSMATLSPPPTPVSTSTTSKRARISSFEIRRIKASVMKQVRWKKVALHVACNRSPSVYERGVQGAFDAWMKDTIEEEGKGVSSQDTEG